MITKENRISNIKINIGYDKYISIYVIIIYIYQSFNDMLSKVFQYDAYICIV